MGALPVEVTLLLASLLGASAFGFIRPYNGPWYYAAVGIGLGTGLGFFLTPAIVEWLEWESQHRTHLVAVGVGLFGMIGCRASVAAAESEATKIVTDWALGIVKRILGKQDPPSSQK